MTVQELDDLIGKVDADADVSIILDLEDGNTKELEFVSISNVMFGKNYGLKLTLVDPVAHEAKLCKESRLRAAQRYADDWRADNKELSVDLYDTVLATARVEINDVTATWKSSDLDDVDEVLDVVRGAIDDDVAKIVSGYVEKRNGGKK